MSQDPVDLLGGQINLYSYVGNSPLQRVDPNGTCPVCAYIIIITIPIAEEEGSAIEARTIQLTEEASPAIARSWQAITLNVSLTAQAAATRINQLDILFASSPWGQTVMGFIQDTLPQGVRRFWRRCVFHHWQVV